MRMLPKRPIGGSSDAGATEAPEHGVKMETEVVVSANKVPLDLETVDGAVLQPTPAMTPHIPCYETASVAQNLSFTELKTAGMSY
ncbi:E3 ubiquitin-protein ligase [Hordeum vulgare]|nr:E3 ubiquitin-protein ligase [Hordeum vulgare]